MRLRELRELIAAASLTTVFGSTLSCVGAAPAGGETQPFPTKPVRVLVGFTPGVGPDITARYIAQKLAEPWKQQVVVDNRPGAGGTVAAQTAATANPDGYTL